MQHMEEVFVVRNIDVAASLFIVLHPFGGRVLSWSVDVKISARWLYRSIRESWIAESWGKYRLHNADLNGMISLSCERRPLCLTHGPLHYWFCTIESAPSIDTLVIINWWGKCYFRALTQDNCLLSGSLALDWCALQEALYKCIDTIQYNTIYNMERCTFATNAQLQDNSNNEDKAMKNKRNRKRKSNHENMFKMKKNKRTVRLSWPAEKCMGIGHWQFKLS